MMKIKKMGQSDEKIMKCSKCGNKMILKEIGEYHLDTIGLPNVWLINIDGYECTECHDRSIILPNYGTLMTVVAEIVMFKNGSYTGQELRFLMKYLGIKGKELAGKLGTNPKTISFWLTGKSSVSPAYGVRLRKYLLEQFNIHLGNKKDEYRRLYGKLQKLLEIINAKEESNYKEYIRHQAQLAVKRKMVEFKSVMNKEIPTFKIPNSSAEVQLRYS